MGEVRVKDGSGALWTADYGFLGLRSPIYRLVGAAAVVGGFAKNKNKNRKGAKSPMVTDQ